MSSNDYPYQKYEIIDNWKVIERAVSDLVKNGDLIAQTDRKYVVGYICKLLDDEKNRLITSMGLNEEQEKITELLKGKVVHRILRHRCSEVVIEFIDGSCFIIDAHGNELEFSVTSHKSVV